MRLCHYYITYLELLVMLLRVYIHTGQAWKICLTTVGIEPTTLGIPEVKFVNGVSLMQGMFLLRSYDIMHIQQRLIIEINNKNDLKFQVF
jgi:hypothetical protein